MGRPKSRYDRRRQMYAVVETGNAGDLPSRAYDILITLAILINLAASLADTFDQAREQLGPLLGWVESVTVLLFTVDYFLRVWTAKCARPALSEVQAVLKYVFSFTGIVDLLSFLPYFLPIFFPSGAVAFRMFRVVRIFRLFRINAYYDSLNVIAEVIVSKSQQLISSVFIILVLMLASSLCMYSLEHEAQPEVFANAFSGIWWSVSTLLTIGYGDIYPITTLGKAFSIVITFLGVGMVAIPTGIISAGFVDQYSRIKRISEYAYEEEVHFIKTQLSSRDSWAGCTIKELGLPNGIIVAAIQRGKEILVPRGGVQLLAGDTLVLGAESFAQDSRIELKELLLKSQHPWNRQRIRDLDISRQTVIVMVKRRGKMLIPNGDLLLMEGDKLLLYTQRHMAGAGSVQL